MVATTTPHRQTLKSLYYTIVTSPVYINIYKCRGIQGDALRAIAVNNIQYTMVANIDRCITLRELLQASVVG